MGVFLFFQALPAPSPLCLCLPLAPAGRSPGPSSAPGWLQRAACLGREASALPLRHCLRTLSVPVPEARGVLTAPGPACPSAG